MARLTRGLIPVAPRRAHLSESAPRHDDVTCSRGMPRSDDIDDVTISGPPPGLVPPSGWRCLSAGWATTMRHLRAATTLTGLQAAIDYCAPDMASLGDDGRDMFDGRRVKQHDSVLSAGSEDATVALLESLEAEAAAKERSAKEARAPVCATCRDPRPAAGCCSAAGRPSQRSPCDGLAPCDPRTSPARRGSRQSPKRRGWQSCWSSAASWRSVRLSPGHCSGPAPLSAAATRCAQLAAPRSCLRCDPSPAATHCHPLPPQAQEDRPGLERLARQVALPPRPRCAPRSALWRAGQPAEAPRLRSQQVTTAEGELARRERVAAAAAAAAGHAAAQAAKSREASTAFDAQQAQAERERERADAEAEARAATEAAERAVQTEEALQRAREAPTPEFDLPGYGPIPFGAAAPAGSHTMVHPKVPLLRARWEAAEGRWEAFLAAASTPPPEGGAAAVLDVAAIPWPDESLIRAVLEAAPDLLGATRGPLHSCSASRLAEIFIL